MVLVVNPRNTGNVTKSDEKPVVKIGATLPLTGPLAFLGQGAQNSILLAEDYLKNKETKFNYVVIFEDDKFEVKEASTTTSKLINVDKADAIISFSSGIGNVVSPITQSNKVLHIGAGTSDPNVAKGKYNFIHWTTPQEENRVFVKELEERGIKKLALIEVNQQGVFALANDLENKIKGTNIKIVSRERFNSGIKDFRTILLKSKEENPEIYLILAFSPDIEVLTKQAKELGITKLTTVESFELTNQPELFEGLWYVNGADPTNKFLNSYKEEYNQNPPFLSANAYDVFNLIVEAYENAGEKTKGKPTTEQAAEELSKLIGYNGAVGVLTISREGIIDSKASVRMIKNGKPITIKTNSEEVIGLG